MVMPNETPEDVVIDCHCHVGRSLPAEELIEMMDAAGVGKAVVFVTPFLWGLLGQADYHDTNDYIADVQREHPDRLIGFACVNPHLAPGRELERCVKELGLRGVKIHPENHCFAVDSLIGGEIMEAIVALQKETGVRIPILSHGMTTIGAMPDQFGRLAGSYPNVYPALAAGRGRVAHLRGSNGASGLLCPGAYVGGGHDDVVKPHRDVVAGPAVVRIEVEPEVVWLEGGHVPETKVGEVADQLAVQPERRPPVTSARRVRLEHQFIAVPTVPFGDQVGPGRESFAE